MFKVQNVAEQRSSKFKCSRVQRNWESFKTFKPFNRAVGSKRYRSDSVPSVSIVPNVPEQRGSRPDGSSMFKVQSSR